MAHVIIRLLQFTCLILLAMILTGVFGGMIEPGSQFVPLDPEGHMAPFSDAPFFGI